MTEIDGSCQLGLPDPTSPRPVTTYGNIWCYGMQINGEPVLVLPRATPMETPSIISRIDGSPSALLPGGRCIGITSKEILSFDILIVLL